MFFMAAIQACVILGGSIVDSVDAATVLVTESVKRTQKLLAAVGQGKPICSPVWLKECKKANSFLGNLIKKKFNFFFHLNIYIS